MWFINCFRRNAASLRQPLIMWYTIRTVNTLKLLTFLRRQAFGLAVILSSAIAFCWPTAFDTWCGVKLLKLVSPALGLIMFGMGTTLTVQDFLRVAKMPAAVGVGVLLQFLVMPCLGLALTQVFGLEGELGAGVILVGCVAGGTASNVISYLAKANVALSVTMTCCSTLLSPLLTPLLMRSLAGRLITIDTGAMTVEILKIVLLPVIAGVVVHALLRGFFERHKQHCDRVLSIVSTAGICFILLTITAQSQAKFREAGALILVVAILHNSFGFACGYWLTRLLARILPLSETDARTVAIEVGMQNSGMACALANSVLHSATAALPGTIFSLWMNFSGSLLASHWGKKPASATASVKG